MKKGLLSILCALALACTAFTQEPQLTLPEFKPEQLQEDFKIARSALEEGHSGIYRYTKKAELDRVFDAAAKSLDKPMNAVEFYRVLAPVVAAIKCGHTEASLPVDLSKEIDEKARLLPLFVKVLSRDVFVLRDLSSEGTKLSGKQIRSINGIPASRIVETMLAATSGDGDVQTSRLLQIGGWRFGRNLVTLLEITSPYNLVVSDEASKRDEKVRVEGIALPKLRESWKTQFPQDRRVERAGDLNFHDDGKIARMTIRGFGGFVDDEKKKDLKVFYKEAFEEIQAKGAKSLIIDLRNNGGGEDELGKLLLSYLIDKPFKYYNDLIVNKLSFDFFKYTGRSGPLPSKVIERGTDNLYHAVGHPNWGIQQPSKPTFSGKVFILINGNSFSTTSEFLSHAHYHRRATFIGEESGGGYYGNSSGFMPWVTLPNTKLTLRVPLMTYYMAVKGYKAAARGVVPDHPVTYTIAELIAGTDKELAVALRLARQQ